MGQTDVNTGAAANAKPVKNTEKFNAERACEMLGVDAPTKFCIVRKFKNEETLEKWKEILKSCS